MCWLHFLLSQTLFSLKGTYVNIMPLSLSPCLIWSWTGGPKGVISARFRSEIPGEIHHQIGTQESEGPKELLLANTRFFAGKPEARYKRYLELCILQLDTVINSARLWDMFFECLCNDLKRLLEREGILEHPTQDKLGNVYYCGLYNELKFKIMIPWGKDYRNTPKCQDDVAISILFYNILWREMWIMMLQ
jgi:hypothetical protein